MTTLADIRRVLSVRGIGPNHLAQAPHDGQGAAAFVFPPAHQCPDLVRSARTPRLALHRHRLAGRPHRLRADRHDPARRASARTAPAREALPAAVPRSLSA